MSSLRSVALGALALSASLLVVPSPAQALPPTKPIQPGGPLSTPVGGCTQNFIFAKGAKRYVGTAGHCGTVGQRVRSGSLEFGTIVYSKNTNDIDFALIEIDAEDLDQIEPSMRGWGGPTRIIDHDDTQAGDLLLLSGYGMVFGSNANTRNRPGIIVSDDAQEYVAQTLAVNGDSGGPLIHEATGAAYGVISHYGFSDNTPQPSTDVGNVMEHIMLRLSQAGFPVTLVTAGYTAPL